MSRAANNGPNFDNFADTAVLQCTAVLLFCGLLLIKYYRFDIKIHGKIESNKGCALLLYPNQIQLADS